MSLISLENTELYRNLKEKAVGIAIPINKLLGEYQRMGGGVYQDFAGWPDHFLNHISGVLENINKILGRGDYFSLLEEQEWEMLLKATILHDVGKIRTKSDAPGLTTATIRDEHHLRGKVFLNKYYKGLGLQKEEGRIIGEIIAAHRLCISLNDIDEEAAIDHKQYRVRFLAAILRLADELHVTRERAAGISSEIYEIDGLGEIHLRLHEDVRGIRYDKGDKSVIIERNLTFEEEAEYYEDIREKIREVFETVKPVITAHDVDLRDVRVFWEPEEGLGENELKIKNLLLAGPKTMEEVNIELGIDYNRVKEIVTGLKVVRVLEEEGGKYNLVPSYDVFKNLSGTFLGEKEYEIPFLNSKYVREDAKKNVVNELAPRFGFSHEESDEFIEKLLLSPTAVQWVLFDERVEAADLVLNPENKKGQFYAILLAGFSTDIVFHPELCTGENIEYFNSLANESRARLNNFYSLIAEYKKKLNSFPKQNYPEDIARGKLSLTFTSAGRGFPDVNKLLFAASKTGQKLRGRATAACFEDSSGLREFHATEDSAIFVEITPSVSLPSYGTRKMFCTFKEGGISNDELQLWLVSRYDREVFNNDYLVISISLEEGTSGKMVLTYPEYIDVGYLVSQLDIINGINERRYKYAAIIDAGNNATLDYGRIDRFRVNDIGFSGDGFLGVIKGVNDIRDRPKMALPTYVTKEQNEYLNSRKPNQYKLAELYGLKPRDSFHNFRRLIYGGFETGVEDIETLGFKPGFFELGHKDGSRRSTLRLFDELLTPEGKKATLIYSKFFLPFDARGIFEQFKAATGNEDFVRAFDPVFNSKGLEERESVFYIVIYPEKDYFWCDAQVIDFCSFYLSGLARLLENGDYFINIAKEYEKAKYYYHEAEKTEPDSYFISSQLGWAYLATGDFTNAFKYLEAAESLDIENEDATYLFNLGLYFLAEGKEEIAISYYNKALNTGNWRELLPAAIEDIDNFVKKGYIKEKISAQFRKNLVTLQKGTAERNEYCPCWSGKKYKKCHGGI